MIITEYGVPLPTEESAIKLGKLFIKHGYANVGAHSFDASGVPIALLFYQGTKAFLIYRSFCGLRQEIVDQAFSNVTKIPISRAIKILKK